MRAPAIAAGRQVLQQAVGQKRGIAMLRLIRRRGIRPAANRNIEIIASRHIIALSRKIASPGAAVFKPQLKRFKEPVHHLLIGCQDRIIGSIVARVGCGVGIAI